MGPFRLPLRIPISSHVGSTTNIRSVRSSKFAFPSMATRVVFLRPEMCLGVASVC